jgi:formylglycine-generating enzyme required for sulfatase activity
VKPHLLLWVVLWIGCFFVGTAAAQTATPTPAPFELDLNSDGDIDARDLIRFLEGWQLRELITPTPTPPSTFLQGFVRSAEDLSAIQGARVVAGTATTFSLSDGFYQIPQALTGMGLLQAEKAGFIPFATSLIFTAPLMNLTLELVPLATATPSPTPSPTPEGIRELEIPGTRRLAFVRIPAGGFQMGSPPTEAGRFADEGPVHEVVLAQDFYLSQTEVTQAQWEWVMGGFPIGFATSGATLGDDYPMTFVSFQDIASPGGFLDSLAALVPGEYRLPSEAEWEYACRAGTQTRFFYGNSLGCDGDCADCAAELLGGVQSDYMVYCDLETGPLKVASVLPNQFGLFDMHGNAFEWCADWFHPNYNGAPSDGSAWLEPSTAARVIRGGDYFAPPALCRSAFRSSADPDLRLDNLGFRVVLEVEP